MFRNIPFANPLLLLSAGLLSASLLTACGGGSVGGSPASAALKFSNFQPASAVIGQPDFASNSANQGIGAGDNTLNQPYGRVSAGSLYVPDTFNNRVLGFNSIPAAANAIADFVLGQTSFGATGSGTSASQLHGPADSVTAGGELFVVDTNNSRVLIWNTLPTGNTAADVVVGQPNFTSGANPNPPTLTSMNNPRAVAAGGGVMAVADTANNRVLIYDSIPTTNGASPDTVLGQPGYVTSTANYGGESASSLHDPEGVWTDGHKLIVADEVNNRVLIWNQIPTLNNTPADVVVGNSDFVGTYPSDPAAQLNEPSSVYVRGDQLFVADQVDHRVLIWNHIPTTNGAPADVVLGQGDFSHTAANDDNQDGTADAHPTARTLSFVNGVFVSGNKLFVTDRGNNRVLIYTAQ